MKIETLKTSELVPYARNAKKHSDQQISQIAGSIREFGFNNPVLVDGEKPPGIIAGHGRVLAAQKLGMEKLPCVRLGHLSEAQKRAYLLADNRLAETGGGWDMDVLRIEIDELSGMDVDIDSLGFGEGFDLSNNECDNTPAESSSQEIDVDGMEMQCRCPKCGFEFDPK